MWGEWQDSSNGHLPNGITQALDFDGTISVNYLEALYKNFPERELTDEELKEVMKHIDILILNDGEVRMLAGEENLILAAESVLEMKNGGILVVKKGENGVIAFHPEGKISIPSYPTSNLVDPTGCGDSFAGSMAHYLSRNSGPVGREELAESLVHATVTASFTIESFGTERIRMLSIEEYESRVSEYRSITNTS